MLSLIEQRFKTTVQCMVAGLLHRNHRLEVGPPVLAYRERCTWATLLHEIGFQHGDQGWSRELVAMSSCSNRAVDGDSLPVGFVQQGHNPALVKHQLTAVVGAEAKLINA